MGFFVDPVKVQIQAQPFDAVFITWDGTDPSKVTVRQLSTQLCLDPNYLFRELLLHEENEDVLDQLMAQSASFAVQHKKDMLQRSQLLVDFLGPADSPDGDTNHAPELSKHMQLHLLLELKMPFAGFTIDFSKVSGIVLRVAADKAQWDQCRASQSKLAMRNRAAVEAYKSALKALLPLVRKLEQDIATIESAIVAWRNGPGKAALNALAFLTVTHEMTTVYAQQDDKANRLVARTSDLTQIVGNQVAQSAARAVSLDPLINTYQDRDFGSKLRDYFEAWDATHVYYFETVASRGTAADAKDLVGFDKRLFKAIGRTGELLATIDSHAQGIADELDAAAQAAWRSTVDRAGGPKAKSDRVARSRVLADELLKNATAGWVSLFVTWSGVATTAAGNMEGPPSVLAIFLKAYSKSEAFINRLGGRDGFLRAFVLIGVDEAERKGVMTLLAKGDQLALDTARNLFTNGSWRSPTVFFCYYCVTAALLIIHLKSLADTFQGDDIDAQLIKAALPVIQDATGVLLIGLTHYYSREMAAYLTSKGASNVQALAEEINRLEQLTPQAKAARVAHKGLSLVTLVLAVWSLADDSITADKFEDRLLLISVAGAGLTFVGSLLAESLLGPAGVIIGLVITLVAIGYQTWFKPKLAAAMQSVGKTLLVDPFLKSIGGIKAGEASAFIIFTRDVSLTEMLSDTVEELNDFDWQKKLRLSDLVDYARAGLPLSMVAQLYGLQESDVQNRVRAARQQARALRLAQVKPAINLVRPGTLQVQLEVGLVNEIKLEVVNRDRSQLPNNIWLEVAFPDPDALLADGSQQPATSYRPEQVVMLFTDSSTSSGRVYQGSFRLNIRPDDGQVRFEVFVPADRFATGPKPGLARATVTKDLTFNVAP